jgi:hypothetical protein
MSPRDPTDLARLDPAAQPLVETLDALYSLLEAVEMYQKHRNDGNEMCAFLTARHARACWDELTRRDGPQERAANARIQAYMDEPGEAAEIKNFSVSGKRR